MKRLLVTGLTGFVGVNLKRMMSKEYTVVGVYREPEKLINYNNLDIGHFNSSDFFLHLAGKAHDLKGTSKPEEYFEVNTELTKRLFDQFLESKCKIFIFVSSVKAVKDHLKGELTEDTIPDPQSPYGKSKLEAEEYILKQELPKDKKVYILRPCMIHGPNNKGNLNLLYKIVKIGIPSPFGQFNNKRSFVSIDNFCFIIEQLLNKRPDSGIYNIADDQSFSINELMQIMGSSLGKPIKVLRIPRFFIKSLSKVGDYLSFLPLNSERLEKMTENYRVSNTKICKALEIDELPIKAKDGLKQTTKSFIYE